MRVACIIQARSTSRRLPGKVHMSIGGKSMIEHVIERVEAAEVDCDVAWPSAHEDENDVLARYYRRATEMRLDAIIRVTGDCPLMDPQAITDVLHSFQTLYRTHPFVTNDEPRTYPCGLGLECWAYHALEYTHRTATDAYDREHVSPFILRDSKIAKANVYCPINGLSDLKLSVDTKEDLDFVRAIHAAGPKDFSLAATLEAIKRVSTHWPQAVRHVQSQN